MPALITLPASITLPALTKKPLLILALILSLPCGCGGGGGGGEQNSSQLSEQCSLKVTNGDQCATGSGPVVLLELLDNRQTLVATCTGAFIGPQHVLTGAHCFDGGITGANIRYSDKRIASQSIAIPAEYSGETTLSRVDFAIVTLQQPAEDAEILPLLVSRPVTLGDTLNIIGYGQDENGNSALQGNEYEESLKKGTMIVSDIEANLRLFAAEFNDTQQSVCSGDSGGPAIVLNRDGLAGIAGVAQAVADPQSDGSPVCLTDTVAVFTNMQDQRNLAFIKAIVPAVGEI